MIIDPALRLGFTLTITAVSIFSSTAFGRSSQPAAVVVEPAELAKHDDLIGREIVVDDRLRYFQFHPGQGYDEIHLKRTPVVFQLPRALRPQSAPTNPAIQIQGVLKRDGNRLACEVRSFQLHPADLERLENGAAGLPANDFQTRKAWSSWALQRAQAFDDQPLRQKALTIEADAYRLEARSIDGPEAPQTWMRLAESARSRGIPEPEPSALAHQAFHAKLSSAQSVQTLNELIGSIEQFFPGVKGGSPQATPPVRLETLRNEYSEKPGDAYRKAPADVRAYLDRRLWIDAMEKRMRLAARDDPRAAIDLAVQAKTQIPEQKDLVNDLVEIGIESAFQTVAGFRLAEATAAARTIRERFGRPDMAAKLLEEWLKVQRGKLSRTDADGRLSLAAQYEELLGDQRSALGLIREAWKIDPNSKPAGEAFRRRGYHNVGGEWVEDGSRTGSLAIQTGSGDPSAAPAAAQADPRPTGLRGLGPEEVLRKLGSKPSRIVFSASKGKLIEQWIYNDPTHIRYVNFIRTPNQLNSRVVSDYSLRRTLRDGRPGRPR